MGRGGIGARKAMAERIQRSSRYRLIGVQTGSNVAECLDKYGRWHLGHRTGRIVKLISQTVWVHWDDTQEIADYRQEDARYKVDRGLWRITAPTPKSVFSVLSEQRADALTNERGKDRVPSSPPAGGDTLTEEAHVATRRSKKQTAAPKVDQVDETIPVDDEEDDIPAPPGLGTVEVVPGGVLAAALNPQDDEDDDELDDDGNVKLDNDDESDDDDSAGQDAEPELEAEADDEADDDEERSGKTLTPKNIARILGTDAKTLRKFFRSSASTVEPVGQGGRYEFAEEDLAKIKAEFEKSAGGSTRKPKADGEPTADKAPRSSRKSGGTTRSRKATEEVVVEEDDEELSLEDEEPTPDELAELDDLEVEDDDEV